MTLRTTDALEFARIGQTDWSNATRRGIYTEAPATVMGRPAKFDRDDLVAAHVLGQLIEREVMPSFAGQIATDVRRLLRKLPDVATLSAWKVPGKHGPRVVVAASPMPDAIELFRFEIAEIRRRAQAGIDAKRREQHRHAAQ